MDHQDAPEWLKSLPWLHDIPNWALAAIAFVMTGAWKWTHSRYKKLINMDRDFVTTKQFEAYKQSRERRDELLDGKLDDIKDAISDGLREVHDRVDKLYDSRGGGR